MSLLFFIIWNVASLVIFIGAFVVAYQSHIPQIIRDLFEFGKVREKRRSRTIIQYLEVPKRCAAKHNIIFKCINYKYSFSILSSYDLTMFKFI